MLKSSLVLTLFSSLAIAQSVTPGIWRADTKFHVNGIPLPDSKDEKCISAGEAKDIKKAITKELDAKGCEVAKWIAKGQKVDVTLKCNKSGLDARGNLRGTISSKSYDLTGDAEGTYQRIPSQASLTLKGQWIKSCPK